MSLVNFFRESPFDQFLYFVQTIRLLRSMNVRVISLGPRNESPEMKRTVDLHTKMIETCILSLI